MGIGLIFVWRLRLQTRSHEERSILHLCDLWQSAANLRGTCRDPAWQTSSTRVQNQAKFVTVIIVYNKHIHDVSIILTHLTWFALRVSDLPGIRSSPLAVADQQSMSLPVHGKL